MRNLMTFFKKPTAASVVDQLVRRGEIPADLAPEAEQVLSHEMRRAMRRYLREAACTSARVVLGTRLGGSVQLGVVPS